MGLGTIEIEEADMGMYLIMGIALAFNIIVLLIKWRKLKRYLDTVVDAVLLAIVLILCHGSVTTMMMGVVASGIVSFYLLISPIRWNIKGKRT